MRRAAHVAKQALKAGLKARTPFLVTPGSERIYQTIKRDGHHGDASSEIGGTVLANACGPCIGQWKRSDVAPGRAEHHRLARSTATSPGATTAARRRCPSSTSPEIVTALAFAGTLAFNPLHRHAHRRPTARRSASRRPRREELPARGLRARATEGYEAPAADGEPVQRRRPARTASGCSCSSPSPRWDGRDFDRPADPGQDQGQDDDRPHLAGRARGCASAATWTRSATTCSWARSTPSPARPARASTC